MDFQTQINNMMKAQRAEELQDSEQLMLGELILKLEAVENKDLPLFIDIMDKRPMGIGSWRGSYCELSIQTEEVGSYQTDEVESEHSWGTSYKHKKIGKEDPTVKEWIEVLTEAVGKTFVGWKGGDFYMGKNTPVWLAENGASSFLTDDNPIDTDNYMNYKNVFFIDVKELDGRVYLITEIQED